MLVDICVLANLGLALATVLVAVTGTGDVRRERVVIAIAGASVAAFIITQCVMPAGMDIRVDLLLTVPATVVAMGFGARALRRLRQEP